MLAHQLGVEQHAALVVRRCGREEVGDLREPALVQSMRALTIDGARALRGEEGVPVGVVTEVDVVDGVERGEAAPQLRREAVAIVRVELNTPSGHAWTSRRPRSLDIST